MITNPAFKQAYLLQLLSGRALELVKSIPTSATGYIATLEVLNCHFGSQKRLLHIALKSLILYQPPAAQKHIPHSETISKNWTSLLQMTRRIQNAKKGDITSQDILCSLVQLKIHPLIATEVEKLVADKENLQLEELFTIVNGLVQARELTEVNKNFAT